MPSYRRDETGGPFYSRIKCFKCQKVGHAARNCVRLTHQEKLYDIDRIETGIKFRHYKFTDVTVTCPGLKCSLCKAIDLAAEKAKKLNLYVKNEETRNCGCIIPDPETVPVDEFKDLHLDKRFVDNIVNEKCCNFDAPTPIQRYALPIITEGYDVMGCAQTGTGKTAAYIIPMVKFIKDNGYSKKAVGRRTPQRPEVLILAPTRELATQIAKTTRKLTNDIKPSCAVCLVFGGNRDRREQQAEIRRGCNILIGTTGRVLQLIDDYAITLDNIKFFVLDEADKMLDMGFGPDIDIIIDERKTFITPKNRRQSLLFSATFRDDLRQVARKSLKDDHRLIQAGEIGSAQPDVEQKFEMVEDLDGDGEKVQRSAVQEQKLSQLKKLLFKLMLKGEETFREHRCWEDEPYDGRKHPNLKDFLLHVLGGCSDRKILIFVSTRIAAREISYSVSDYLYDQLTGRFSQRFGDLAQEDDNLIDNFGAIYMSGELAQHVREANLDLFKDGVYPIMVSTNVLARGIDIEGVTHVINFDLPQDLRNLPKFREHDEEISRDKTKKKPERNQFEEYIHRIGRTGRAGNTGIAITFFEQENDKNLAIPLVRMLSKANQLVPKWLEKIAEEQGRFESRDKDEGKSATHEKYKLVNDQKEKDEKLENILLAALLKGDKKFWSPKHQCGSPSLRNYLQHMLGKCSYMKIMIFVSSVEEANKLAENVTRYLVAELRRKFENDTEHQNDDKAIPTDHMPLCVHEGLSKDARTEIFKNFSDRLHPILICTNTVMRGMNMENITHIINYNLPRKVELLPRFQEPEREIKDQKKKNATAIESTSRQSIYRINPANTGNVQNVGEMIAFFQRNRDEHLAIPLEEMLYAENQKVPKWLAKIAEEQRGGKGGGAGPAGEPGPSGAGQPATRKPSSGKGRNTDQWNIDDGLCPDEIWGSDSIKSEES
ncbi:hypothetical protein ACHWQZ_G018777 [Mnemiopsis leidyi]